MAKAADPPSPSSPVSFLYATLDEVIGELSGQDHVGQVATARAEYEGRRGRVFEDEELWENWTQAFLEWYAVERVPDGLGRAGIPAAGHLRAGADASADAGLNDGAEPGASAEALRRSAALRAWLTSYRSLFEVRALLAEQVEVVDLLAGGRFAVAEKRAMVGVSIGDVAELRLLGFEDEVVFGRTFCFHPAGTRAAILGHARRIRAEGGSRADIVDYCAGLRIRCERYRHVSALRIYESATGEIIRAGSGGAQRGP